MRSEADGVTSDIEARHYTNAVLDPNPSSRRAELLSTVDRLRPAIVDAAGQAERERTLPPALAREMSLAGLFRMSVPTDYGGSEAPLSTQLEVIERVAQADASAGWCVMIASTTSMLCGQWDDAVVQEIFGEDRLASVCGVYAPKGKAEAVEGGYRVTGRWSFASGCRHSSWRLGGAMLPGHGDGPPQMRLMMFRAEDTVVHDTWRVAGLRGTGSHDIEVKEAFVPAARAVDPGRKPHRDQLLYRMPLFGALAAEVAAVALGIARAAIDAFVQLATAKVPAGGRKTLAQRGTVQALVAEAEGGYRAGRAGLLEAARVCEAQASDGAALGAEARLSLRLAANEAVRAAVRAVDMMYRAGGGTSLYEDSPLQRHLRDVHATTQHAMVSLGIDELCGRALLGHDVPAHQL